MSDARDPFATPDRRGPDWQLAVLEAAELRRHQSELRRRIVRHSFRAFLGALPLALGVLPQFRLGVGLSLILVVPLTLLIINEVRRARASYRELQATRLPPGAPDSAGGTSGAS